MVGASPREFEGMGACSWVRAIEEGGGAGVESSWIDIVRSSRTARRDMSLLVDEAGGGGQGG